jgi:hypothetical protein
MAKDGDFIMRRLEHWDIGLYNNSHRSNNATKSRIFFPSPRRFPPLSARQL